MKRTQFQSMFIEEPLLTFGEQRRYIDPKMGLLAYGPCIFKTRRAISSSIRLGIIGSRDTINLAQHWINKCQGEIPGKDNYPRLFPSFPGFTRIFGSELRVLTECIEVLREDEIDQAISETDFHTRVRNAARLILNKLSNFKTREPRPHVVIIAFPQKIIDGCGTVEIRHTRTRMSLSRREKEMLNIIRRHRRTGQTELIPFNDSILDMIPEMSDLRRIIKAEAMTYGIPTQLAKTTTFMPNFKDSSIQDEATRAWNFCVALYYKAEGYPWKLADMPVGTCYIGVTFYKVATPAGDYTRASLAQIFTHTGEGLVLKGGRAIIDQRTKIPHLSEQSAFQLMKDALKLYQNQMDSLPIRLVIHKSSRYWPEEIMGFKKAAEGIKNIDFITIQTRGIRFMRGRGIYPPIRGTVIQIAKDDYILFTKGWIPFHETYAGLRVPVPLEIVEHYGPSTIDVVCKEILSLTKMNWNSADFCIREPITLAYAREVGKILAYVPEEVIPRPEYRFYM